MLILSFMNYSAIVDLVCQKDEEMGFSDPNAGEGEDSMNDDT